MVKLTSTCALLFVTLCCDSCCIYVLDFNVMGLLFVLREHVSDSKCLCLLRAKINGCFFFQETLFLCFISVCVGHLIHVKAGRFLFFPSRLACWVILICAIDLSEPQRNTCLDRRISDSSSFFVYLQLLIIRHVFLVPSIMSLLLFLIRHIPRHQFANDLPSILCLIHTHKALCIWGIWTAFLGRKSFFFKDP